MVSTSSYFDLIKKVWKSHDKRFPGHVLNLT